MLLKLYQAGQPILRKKAKLLTKKQLATQHTQNVIDLMITTLREAPGVGLAAPQVGESLTIVIIEDKADYHYQVPKPLLKAQGRKPVSLKVLVNPKIEIIETEPALFFEGCLSVEGYVAVVPRATKVKVRYWNRKGQPLSYEASGWHARTLQHELDHLSGRLYIDRMNAESFMSIKNFSMLWRKAMPDKINRTFGDKTHK